MATVIGGSVHGVAVLEVVTGQPAGMKYPISAAGATVGRDPTCQVVVHDSGTSRKHAQIFPDNVGFSIRDLGSSNGTFVNGIHISAEVMLRTGDMIRIGTTTFRFTGPDSHQATTSPDLDKTVKLHAQTIASHAGAVAKYAMPKVGSTNFNWGAFFLGWVWGVNHGALWTTLPLVLGLVGTLLNELGPENLVRIFNTINISTALLLQIWFGVKGNRWAWESGRFRTLNEMVACQRIWALWGMGFFALMIIIYAAFSCGLVAGAFPRSR